MPSIVVTLGLEIAGAAVAGALLVLAMGWIPS